MKEEQPPNIQEDDNDDSGSDLGCLLFAIVMVMMLAFCDHHDELDRIDRDLQGIEHELRMLNIKQ